MHAMHRWPRHHTCTAFSTAAVCIGYLGRSTVGLAKAGTVKAVVSSGVISTLKTVVSVHFKAGSALHVARCSRPRSACSAPTSTAPSSDAGAELMVHFLNSFRQ